MHQLFHQHHPQLACKQQSQMTNYTPPNTNLFLAAKQPTTTSIILIATPAQSTTMLFYQQHLLNHHPARQFPKKITSF
jgi:hypothetical protein